MAEFLMPTLGADMAQGTLIEWKKKVGDAVSKGDILAEVDTEKAAIEIESFLTGTIERLLVKPGDRVPVGTAMAIIRTADQPVSTTPQAPVAAVSPEAARIIMPESEEAVAMPAAAPVGGGPRLRASPAAKKLGAELGVDLSQVSGSGPDGAITLDDIRKAAAASIGRPKGAADRQARMRQTIAAAMARSKREIPHYYLQTTIDMHASLEWLAAENRQRPLTERLLYGILLIKAVALALRQVPELNAVWRGPEAVSQADIHVGVAVALRGSGLIAPALHHADQRPLSELMRSFQDLVKRARAGTLRSSELTDPTITVTSLGEQGVETVLGIIYPPQVALVGFGKVVQRPWVVEGQVQARPLITASLSADHRVTDGHRGGLFLAAVDRFLQEPSTL